MAIEKIEKISKEAALYFPPSLNRRDFTCGGCAMFIIRRTEANRAFGVCEILDPPNVDDDDGCALFVPGRSKRHGDAHRLVPARVAGLDEGPFSCKRCRHFGGSEDSPGPCEIVAGTVHPDGCCSAWERS